MTEALIDTAVFSDLSEAMGAAFATELVATFLDEAPGLLAQVREAAATGDADAYRRAAHSIKSNAEIFGASALATQARSMELSGLCENDDAVAALEAVYARTAAALRGMLDE